ncbi:hypothetical protein Gotri_005818, partial [Gossypium trilobum]|nr:hypothetical protein [Gossypium trilobum]
ENVPSVFLAEALAFIQGIQLGLDLGFTAIEVEGDAFFLSKYYKKEGMINQKFVLILEMGKG